MIERKVHVVLGGNARIVIFMPFERKMVERVGRDRQVFAHPPGHRPVSILG